MMKFMQLIEQLSVRIGQHQFPVNTAAGNVRTLVDSSALHYDLASGIVRAIYERNDCRGLCDPVTAQPTFEALGPIRAGLLDSAGTDVDAYRFMEELCAVVAKIFDTHRIAVTPQPPAPSPVPQHGELVSLDAARRRIKSVV